MTGGPRPAGRLCPALIAIASTGALLAGCGGGGGSTAAEPDRPPQGNGSPASPPKEERGEASVEGFGDEAQGSEKGEVLAAEHGYLEAVASGDFRTACSFVPKRAMSSLEAMAGPGSAAGGCPAILPKVLANTAPRIAEEQLHGEVVKVRVHGGRAFVIFHAPGARLFVFPMGTEGDAWKVGTLTASVLAPSAATLGE